MKTSLEGLWSLYRTEPNAVAHFQTIARAQGWSQAQIDRFLDAPADSEDDEQDRDEDDSRGA